MIIALVLLLGRFRPTLKLRLDVALQIPNNCEFGLVYVASKSVDSLTPPLPAVLVSAILAILNRR